MRKVLGLACVSGMLLAAQPAAAQCDPTVCCNPIQMQGVPSVVRRQGFQFYAKAQAHCPADTVVWKDGRAPVFHLKGSPKFGRTATGIFMCKATAVKLGSSLAKPEPGVKKPG